MNKKGSVLITAGILLIVVAMGLIAYNIWIARAAGKFAQSTAERLAEEIPAASVASDTSDEIVYPDYVLNPDMDMPVKQIDGYSYIGLLEIPALGLSLPIQQEWSYPNMKVSPCRYDGSAYLNNMVICGHNYSSHFGNLKELVKGDQIIFTDMDGNRFLYEVAETDILMPDDVEEMVSGDWNLTLFTCTLGGASRVTVRCTGEKVCP